MGQRKKYVSKSSIRRENVTFGCSEHEGVSSRRVSERRKKLVHTKTVQCDGQTAGTRSADYLRFLAEMRAVDPDKYLDMDDSDADDFEVIVGRNAAVLTVPGCICRTIRCLRQQKEHAQSLLQCLES